LKLINLFAGTIFTWIGIEVLAYSSIEFIGWALIIFGIGTIISAFFYKSRGASSENCFSWGDSDGGSDGGGGCD
jgi:hypothetical protein